MGRHNNRVANVCCVCRMKLVWQYGRCVSCYRGMSPVLLAHLKTLDRSARALEYQTVAAHDPLPKWTWEGDEDALVAMVEKQECETASQVLDLSS